MPTCVCVSVRMCVCGEWVCLIWKFSQRTSDKGRRPTWTSKTYLCRAVNRSATPGRPLKCKSNTSCSTVTVQSVDGNPSLLVNKEKSVKRAHTWVHSHARTHTNSRVHTHIYTHTHSVTVSVLLVCLTCLCQGCGWLLWGVARTTCRSVTQWTLKHELTWWSSLYTDCVRERRENGKSVHQFFPSLYLCECLMTGYEYAFHLI